MLFQNLVGFKDVIVELSSIQMIFKFNNLDGLFQGVSMNIEKGLGLSIRLF